MKIYSMSDIHGCLAEFNEALSLILGALDEPDTGLVLLGDYIHGGTDSLGVIKRIIELQEKYGRDKIVALLGNHEEFVLEGYSTIDRVDSITPSADVGNEKYISWLKTLPRYHVVGNTIFVHAGIDEESGDLWKWGTNDYTFTGKYPPPPEIGKIPDLKLKVVAGHVGTSAISGDLSFHDIYFDGESHYYIDGSVLKSKRIPILMVETGKDKYYSVTENGKCLVEPYLEG